jgi:hypothetical protein
VGRLRLGLEQLFIKDNRKVEEATCSVLLISTYRVRRMDHHRRRTAIGLTCVRVRHDERTLGRQHLYREHQLIGIDRGVGKTFRPCDSPSKAQPIYSRKLRKPCEL